MKVIHVASELHPIAKVGGLADVVYGLSKELIRKGHQVEVILPKYESLHLSHMQGLQKVKENLSFTAWQGKVETIPVTLLEIPNISLSRIYGEPDDPNRFITFCKAAASYMGYADIVHLHDWPTAVFSTLTKHKTVLTIHNMQHQGLCDPSLLKSTGLKWSEKFCDPVQKDRMNILRTGLEHADLITTVSPTYAKEILETEKGCGLQKILIKRGVTGILNGIDTEWWDPAIDPNLAARYHPDAEHLPALLEAKKANRIHLQEKLQMAEPKGRLVSAITRLDVQKGPELIRAGIHHALQMGHQCILLGTPSTDDMRKEFTNFQKEYAADPNVHFHFEFDHALGHLLYAASDLILVPSLFEPCGLTQMLAMRYGTLPLVRKTGGLADTVTEGENGFVFETASPQEITAALDRAFACDQERWEAMVANGLKRDLSWSASAKAYIRFYRTKHS